MRECQGNTSKFCHLEQIKFHTVFIIFTLFERHHYFLDMTSHGDIFNKSRPTLFSEPPLNFTPMFNKETTDYYATVPHDVLLIKVWGFAKSCNCEARLDDKYGLSR